MRIIGPPRLDNWGELDWNAVDVVSEFKTKICPELWSAGLYYSVDPIGLIAQSIKETGGGRFGGQVKIEFYNPCGLKVRYPNLFPGITDGDNPLAHAMFPNWTIGAMAHAQHAAAYAGVKAEPGEFIYDPRYTYVVGRHSCENWEDLSGKWAPASDYGQRLVAIARKLQRMG